jgi:hypothetical protein
VKMPATVGAVSTHSADGVLWSGILETAPDSEWDLTSRQFWTSSAGGRAVASREQGGEP